MKIIFEVAHFSEQLLLLGNYCILAGAEPVISTEVCCLQGMILGIIDETNPKVWLLVKVDISINVCTHHLAGIQSC